MLSSALTLGDAAYTAPAADADVFAGAEGSGAQLVRVELETIPEAHPVRRFATVYENLLKGELLPDERDVIQSEEAQPLFAWAKHIEPIEIDGGVDFKVLRQGKRNALRERRTYRDQWMCETVDPEFLRALYREIVACSVLRKPLYSRGRTPTRERAFLYVIRGTFPLFADTKARLRLFQIEAEPYATI